MNNLIVDLMLDVNFITLQDEWTEFICNNKKIFKFNFHLISLGLFLRIFFLTYVVFNFYAILYTCKFYFELFGNTCLISSKPTKGIKYLWIFILKNCIFGKFKQWDRVVQIFFSLNLQSLHERTSQHLLK